RLPTLSCFSTTDTPTTQIYTLSLHDALPISGGAQGTGRRARARARAPQLDREQRTELAVPHRRGRSHAPVRDEQGFRAHPRLRRSEEHTSELQSRGHLVCRLLLEKKKRST